MVDCQYVKMNFQKTPFRDTNDLFSKTRQAIERSLIYILCYLGCAIRQLETGFHRNSHCIYELLAGSNRIPFTRLLK